MPIWLRNVLAIVQIGLLARSVTLIVGRWLGGRAGFWERASPQVALVCIGLAILAQLFAARRRWLYAVSGVLLVASVCITRTGP